MIKLSIIVPVYNVEKYIEQCLNSILISVGARKDIEVIVVDDGTPDMSMAVAAPILAKMSYATIIHQNNQGLSIARNIGLENAVGDYVWFVDSDDWILPDSIDYIIQNNRKFPDIDVYSSVLYVYNENKQTFKNEYNPKRGTMTGKDYLKLGFRQGAVQRFVFKRSFLKENMLQFYPGILHEDNLFGYKMLYMANRVLLLNEMIYCYRIRTSGSIMSSTSIKSAESLIQIHKSLMNFLEESVEVDDRPWFQQVIYHNIDCIFGFCRKILGNIEFADFYKVNKQYIKEQTKFLFSISGKRIYAIRMYYFPISYMKLRYLAGLFFKRF